MTIFILGPAHPLRGGIAAFDERLCVELMEEGHTCQIISYSLQYPSLFFPGKSQIQDGPPPENITITPLINSINPWSWWTTARYINEKNPDVIIFRFWIPFMGPALGSIQRLLKKKQIRMIGLVDNLIPHESRPGDQFLTAYFLKNIHHYIVMSESVKKDLAACKPNAKILNLPHPIYNHYGTPISRKEARETLQIPQNKKVILFFGLVRKYKGLDLLLEAFSMVAKRSDLLLVVAGEFYEPISDYKNSCEKLGIGERIIWHDRFIPNDEVRLYFSACNILALPYKTATQSGVTQVAFHFETPVLITNVGGLGEIILDEVNGLVAEPNANDIARKLEYYFEEDLEQKLRDGMKLEKTKYSWQEFIKNMITLCDE